MLKLLFNQAFSANKRYNRTDLSFIVSSRGGGYMKG